MYNAVRKSFGTTNNYIQPYTVPELLKLIDKAIRYTSRTIRSTPMGRSQDVAWLHPAYTFYVTSDFEMGLKKLKKAYKIEAINELKEAIIKLSVNGVLDESPEDSQTEGEVEEFKLNNGNCWLLYGIIPGAKIISTSIQFAQ